MKNFYKILISLLLTLALCSCIVACGGEEEQTETATTVAETTTVEQTTEVEVQPLETGDNTPIELPIVP